MTVEKWKKKNGFRSEYNTCGACKYCEYNDKICRDGCIEGVRLWLIKQGQGKKEETE